MSIFKKIKEIIINYKKTFILLIIIIVSAGIYYGFFNKDESNKESYLLSRVNKSIIEDSFTISGQIVSDNQVDLKSLVSGNISYIGVKNGSIVNKDDRILTVESYEAQKSVRDAELSLQQSKLKLDQLSAPLDDYNKKLLNDDIISQENNIKSARINYLNNNLQLVPLYSYSISTPILSGSYNCDKEGTYKLEKQSENALSISGLEQDYVNINLDVPVKFGKCGLYITFKSNTNYPINSAWELAIPNQMSNSFINTKSQYDSSIQGYNTKISQDKAQLNRESVTPFDITSAKLSYQQALNTLADARHNLSNYSITAPFTGALTTFTSNTGDYISQGSKVGTLVTNKKIIKIFINETDILKIHLSQKAEITTDSIPDIKIEGEIIDIDTLPTIDGGVVTYAAKVAVNSDDERLRIGLTTNIFIKIKEKGPVLNIPSSAIKSDKKGKYVEVLDKNPIATNINSSSSDIIDNKRFVGNVPVIGNTTHNVYIETGETIGNNTEIISGLNEGDIVIVNKISTTPSDNLLDDRFGGPDKNRSNRNNKY